MKGSKTGGRKPGSVNKTTSEMKEWVNGLVSKNQKQIVKDLKLLEPKDRVMLFERLLQYVIPKANNVNVSFDQLTDRELETIVDSLSKNLEQDAD